MRHPKPHVEANGIVHLAVFRARVAEVLGCDDTQVDGTMHLTSAPVTCPACQAMIRQERERRHSGEPNDPNHETDRG